MNNQDDNFENYSFSPVPQKKEKKDAASNLKIDSRFNYGFISFDLGVEFNKTTSEIKVEDKENEQQLLLQEKEVHLISRENHSLLSNDEGITEASYTVIEGEYYADNSSENDENFLRPQIENLSQNLEEFSLPLNLTANNEHTYFPAKQNAKINFQYILNYLNKSRRQLGENLDFLQRILKVYENQVNDAESNSIFEDYQIQLRQQFNELSEKHKKMVERLQMMIDAIEKTIKHIQRLQEQAQTKRSQG